MRIPATLFPILILASMSFAQGQPAKIMSWEEYGKLSPQWPYLVKIHSARINLLYFGAAHTYNPDDPELAEIERLWQEFHPDIAFNEGGNPPIEKSRAEAVRKYGEPGLIRFLANRDKVPVTSIDQSLAEQVAFFLKRFSPEQVKVFFVLRAVAQQIQNHPSAPLETELERVLSIYKETPGLNVSPNSIGELATSYERNFQGRGDFKQAQLAWFDPVKSETFLNEMSRQLSIYRDQYMVELITRHVREGQRVFAVVGGSHVIMQEKAIKKRLQTSRTR